MSASQHYAIGPGWKGVFGQVGVDHVDVLRKARLPEDLLNRENVKLPAEGLYRFCEAFDEVVADPRVWVQLTDAMSPELFTPPIFAALCSPDMATAAQRLSLFKPLIGPVFLEVENRGGLTLTYRWRKLAVAPPACMQALELLFAVKMARLGTREHIEPTAVVLPNPPRDVSAFNAFLGVNIRRGRKVRVTFSARDAKTPFVTSNGAMWKIFEPELQRRLSDLEGNSSFEQRTRAVLLEGLPSGQFAVELVARRLAVSPRTLQRRLREEGTSFTDVVGATRESLARHYLRRSELSLTEIAYLVGFEEPTSFFRAFQRWTGTTPDRVRSQQVSG